MSKTTVNFLASGPWIFPCSNPILRYFSICCNVCLIISFFVTPLWRIPQMSNPANGITCKSFISIRFSDFYTYSQWWVILLCQSHSIREDLIRLAVSALPRPLFCQLACVLAIWGTKLIVNLLQSLVIGILIGTYISQHFLGCFCIPLSSSEPSH